MNYTDQYRLPQWEKSDRVLMDDFNQAMASIEDGLKEAKTAASHAQNTADIQRYVIGTYAGTKNALKVTLGFRPSAVLIARSYNGYDSHEASESKGECMLFMGNDPLSEIQFEDDGFSVAPYRAAYPAVNWGWTTFLYIAFR